MFGSTSLMAQLQYDLITPTTQVFPYRNRWGPLPISLHNAIKIKVVKCHNKISEMHDTIVVNNANTKIIH